MIIFLYLKAQKGINFIYIDIFQLHRQIFRYLTIVTAFIIVYLASLILIFHLKDTEYHFSYGLGSLRLMNFF